MSFRRNFSVIALIIFLFVAYSSFFIVKEGQQAMVLRLGKIIETSDGNPDFMKPGIHFKIPVLDKVRLFDTRIQELLSQNVTLLTSQQTYLVIDYFAKWRINDLAKFYKSTGGNIRWADRLRKADTLIEQKINDGLRAVYGKNTSNQAISKSRQLMMDQIRKEVNLVTQNQGVEILDVRVRQVALPDQVMDSVFKRMAAERKQFATKQRAEGAQLAEVIKAKADQQVTVIKAQAISQGAKIRAKGDEAAAKIYANAYNKDRKFFEFYRSMQAYQDSFRNKSDVLVLNPDGKFFKYFNPQDKK